MACTAPSKTLRQTNFARWLVSVEPHHEIRGGTTQGGPLEVDTSPSASWLKLQNASTAKEKDRAAILAMAGPYRASFEFQETIGFSPAYKLDRPYRSWGTEYVYVIKEEENFISLQHIMVMFFMLKGDLVGPMVMKHWRQDWIYEPESFHVFVGHGKRRREKVVSPQGTWVQKVFQVDDSPRYSGIGIWQHKADMSYWESSATWRPLPRREFSLRSDYDALIGTNRHTVMADGWTHEQDNLKAIVNSDTHQATKMLAREIGLVRYQRIKNFDFSKGEHYWHKASRFWADVRDFWDAIHKQHQDFTLKQSVYGKKMFEPLFGYAQSIVSGETDYEQGDSRNFISKTLEPYVSGNNLAAQRTPSANKLD